MAERLEDLSGQLDDLADKEAFDLTVSPADEVKRDIPVDPRERALRRQKPKPPTLIPRPKHPREQAKALFPSRDFH